MNIELKIASLGLASVVLLGVSGCLVIVGDDVATETGPSDTSGDGDGDSGDGDADTGDGDSGDGDGDTGDGDGDSGDGDGDSGDGDGDGDTGDGDCAPADPAVGFSYAPLDFGVMDPWNAEVITTCTVVEADLSDGLLLTLDCVDAPEPVILDVSATPTFLAPVAVDDILDIHYIYEGPWWMNFYLRVDLQGYGHLLTLVDGDSLVPEQPFAFTPRFDMQPVYDLCTPKDDGCGNLERLALSFDANGEAVEMLDGSYGIVGGDPGTEVWVREAGHLHDILCTDTPDEWYRVLVVDTGLE